MSPIVKFGGGFIAFCVVLAIFGAAAFHSTPQTPAVTPAADSDQVSPNVATEQQEQIEPPLSKEKAAQALIEYISAVQTKLLVWEVMRQTYLSKIRQDIQFSSLDRFREDAQELKNNAQKIQDDIFAIQRPDNLIEPDGKYFDVVSSAVDDLMTADVTLAVDVAVYADTGLNDQSEMDKDINDAKKARKSFQRAALSAYQHFGYSHSQIDLGTLQPKAS